MIETLDAWLVVTACGWAIFPFLHLTLAPLPDRGFAASRALGLGFAAWIAFRMVGWTGRPLDWPGAVGAIGLLAALSWAGRRAILRGSARGDRDRLAAFLRRHAATLLAIEGVFLLGLVAFGWIARHNPAIDPDSERFMDYAILKAALRSHGLPVADPWFAGEPLRYYHFAYLIAAFMVRAAGADPSRFFVAALAVMHALVWTGAFGLGLALTRRLAGGGLAAGLVLGAGNFEWLRQVTSLRGPSRFDWFASSRVIDGGITEFPWFSLLWGDLHPYVAALPLFLAGLGVAVAMQQAADHRDGPARDPWPVELGRWVLFSLCCGVLAATHPWDLPFLLVAAFLLAIMAPQRRPIRSALALPLAAVAGSLAVWPFVETYLRSGRRLGFVPARTSIAEWILAYGPFVGAAASGLSIALFRRRAARGRGSAAATPEMRAALAMAVTGLAAAAACEVVYVRDLFDHSALTRMNTIFKLYRIAWVCLALCTAAAIVRLSNPAGRWSRSAVMLFVVVCVLPASVYPAAGTLSWLATREASRSLAARQGRDGGDMPGADAEALFRIAMPGDAEAAKVIEDQARSGEAILEESGDPYTWSSRIATFSGVPALLGWGNHEAVWRDDWAPVLERQRAVAEIYRDPGSASSRALLRKYRIAWVVIGERERVRYGEGTAARFAGLGAVVLERQGTTLIRLSE